MLKNEGLVLGRGEVGVVTNLLLDIRDNDNPQDVTVAILDPPRHGRLAKKVSGVLSAVNTFQLDDLEGGLVHYVHDGSSSVEDTVVLQASDGYHFQNILFHIKIAPKASAMMNWAYILQS